jgi:hypothetical protein
MSDFALVADALAVAQDRRATITAYDAATTYKVTINGKVVSLLGTGGTVTTTAAALVALLNGSTVPQEFQEATWSNSSGTLISVMDTPGKPITWTTSVSGGTGTFGAASDTTSNDGPEALTANNVKNVATDARALPSASDTLTLEALDDDVKYALDALSGLTLAALYIEASFSGQCALEPIDSDGATDYDNYRPLYLKAPATLAEIGAGDGDGSNLILLDASSVQQALTVWKTGDSPVLDGLKALIWKGTHASNVVKISSGSMDVAPFAGETATIATLSVGGDADVRTGAGVTLGTVNVSGNATLDITSAAALADITTINLYDRATLIVRGDNAITTINVYSADVTIIYLASGTVGAVNLFDGPTFDATDNLNSFTITTLAGSGKPTVKDPNSRMTVTNAVDPKSGNIFDWTWKLKTSRAFTLGAA